MKYYTDETRKILDQNLLDGAAQKTAESVVKLINGRLDKKNSISSAQLRRFYGDFKALERKMEFKARNSEDSEKAFLSILPLVKMAKSKVAYASNPNNRKVPPDFSDWLIDCIDSIETLDDFKAFLLHFEAVVGFCYGLGLSNN